MGQMRKQSMLIGKIKDKASQGKAALFSKPRTPSLHLALLRATDHDPFSPPYPKHLFSLLNYGNGSRATTSSIIEALMDRLQSTKNSAVALKCLVIIHHIIKHGSFIIHDQLSVYPANGGRNYLNLSNFRDNSNPVSWELSSWVRWYAQCIEQLLCTCRILGFFLGSSSSGMVKNQEEQVDNVSRLTTSNLIRETDSLVDLVCEICKIYNLVHLAENELLELIVKWVDEAYLSTICEISIRVDEFKRHSCPSFGEGVEMVCALTRLEESKESARTTKLAFLESFWDLVREVKEKIGMEKLYGEEGKLSITVRRDRSESARFAEPALQSTKKLVKFPSARIQL